MELVRDVTNKYIVGSCMYNKDTLVSVTLKFSF